MHTPPKTAQAMSLVQFVVQELASVVQSSLTRQTALMFSQRWSRG